MFPFLGKGMRSLKQPNPAVLKKREQVKNNLCKKLFKVSCKTSHHFAIQFLYYSLPKYVF